MNNSEFSPADWVKLYRWYRQNTEALQEQVEAVTDELPKVRQQSDSILKCADSMTRTSELIRAQVAQAQKAWDRAGEVAKTIGVTAGEGATSAVEAATNQMVSSLQEATKDAADVALELRKGIWASRAVFLVYLLLFIAVCLVSSYAAYKKGRSDEAIQHASAQPTERDATLRYHGLALEQMFRQASAKDRPRLEQLYQRVTKVSD
ncbi:hypothetical protein [Paraburkholderia caffeinilytica]|uniref:Uncharacterized protein n=1 Tax=Paraburkholderia caffeinilytica TaxID=1761016 RepID=A0ABQ1M6E7_9BURK|nr:hypothetical protein [Paraburkholderia caffeinilytica]GGC35524.1 hypothetical protein GCM10011400_22700 [Paraburkholderia caffeinilytica]CAB3794299.1 hypothetical protein LMG28690_03901 [Paraburkholderia caffeinilytica]